MALTKNQRDVKEHLSINTIGQELMGRWPNLTTKI